VTRGERLDLDLARALADALRPVVAEVVRDEVAQQLAAAALARWLTVEEAAAQRRTTPGAIRARCKRGQIPGALKEGRIWLIPDLRPAATVAGDHIQRGERRVNGPAPGTRERTSHAR
jgi:hypothetical protein